MRRRRSPPATRTTRTTRGSETLAHALSADRQDDKTLFCVSAVSAFSSPPDAVIDRGALRNDYETMSTRRGGVQWPDSDGSFHLCVAGWSVGQGVSPCTRVCVVGCCSPFGGRGASVDGALRSRRHLLPLYRIFITRVTRFAAVPVVRERAISVHFLIKVTIKLSEIF